MSSHPVEGPLQALILDTTDLARIEDGLSEFNFFEAAGAVRSELRHSDFLAFLLTPDANHGLGDAFLTRFLQRTVIEDGGKRSPISAIQLGIWDLSDCVVQRETDFVDVLIVSDKNAFVVLIENKVDSAEHSDQLRRYEQAIARRYPNHAMLLVYLTLNGHESTHSRYVPVSYGIISSIVEDMLISRGAALNADVAMLLRHYSKLIRTHFMNESELAKLAAQFYLRHQKALDFIFEQKPDTRDFIGRSLTELVQSNNELILDDSSLFVVRFTHRDWPDFLFAKGDDSWLDSNRMLVFEFDNRETGVKLSLYLGPGELETRKRVFEFALNAQPPFKCSGTKLNEKWNTIWTRNFESKLQGLDTQTISLRLSTAWAHFITSELPALHAMILKFVEAESAEENHP